MASLLSNRMIVPADAATPRFAPGAKPRFDSSRTTRTAGVSRASSPAVPSVDPSSTTMTSDSGGSDASTAPQQRSVISAVLNVGMTTEKSVTGDSLPKVVRKRLFLARRYPFSNIPIFRNFL